MKWKILSSILKTILTAGNCRTLPLEDFHQRLADKVLSVGFPNSSLTKSIAQQTVLVLSRYLNLNRYLFVRKEHSHNAV